ncbi:MAG: acyl-CoA thioesterase [Hydrotalea flava]|uniref:acyl-CoA thioesterase n=1 Tax=Hydrotalea flava TaxID=714549 RepID=UPI000829C4FF|nr:thioesterase family protein [Hydrotalea flava]RTL48213.1 MAG: acyl-CoA thioesterase [Sphingobacteriales bacterium]NIM34898.1 acyl-CoA thioesterase [Hydrotalea flava]NIM37728.1 acyl-CoA thioesterase [Hydrotalea flava]NIN02893.1 acyl-CoA thioesterase [Hydrotalea flava]NIN14578.1 acyl-CoA thioesterase [Hydrotalea flava]
MENNTYPPFRFTITVTEAHLDHLKHVNNVVYVQWLQDAAYHHWMQKVPEALHREVLWVVRRHEIDYLSGAFLGDVLEITTWPGEHTGVTWQRHYTIVRLRDNQTIVKATSIWALVHRTNFRPRRIDDTILQVLR